MASLFRSARSTRSTHRTPQRQALAAAAVLATTPVWAQTAPGNDTQLPTVVVTGRTTPTAGIAGWGDVPLTRTPLQARVFDTEQLKDRGVQRLSNLTASDASVSDAYNTEGYVDYLTVRGFVIDNRFNFRRDGLPINAETSIPLENKARIEILKGTSGMQAGTSAPGGLVNYVVKRPLDTTLRSASIEWRDAGSVTGAVDLSQRFGAADAFGLRLNAVAAHLDPKVQSARGERSALALAGDWRLSADTLIEVEFETSHRSQPSVPGFSMLGSVVPAPGDPNINLNNQPWSLPVVFDGNTGSVRWQQRLADGWRLSTHLATQRLRTDDRIAFPFGCTDPNPPPNGTYYADRYCPDGTLDLYDFRSDNERRRTDALDVSLQGRITTGPLSHALTAGVLHSRLRNRFQQQAFNFAGTGNIDGTAVTPAAPALTGENTNRNERSTELYLRDAVTVSGRLTAWLGLRHTRLQRESVGTDGSQPTDYTQSFTTPFVAASYNLTPEQFVYASWGQGIESEVTPNLPRYNTPTTPLPALKSRQIEIGLKAMSAQHEWGVAVFDIVRPLFADFGSCDLDNTCTRQADGTQHHRGIEANTALRLDAWALRGGAQWLRARREGGQDAALNGLQPTNVPARTVKLQAGYTVPQWAGLSLLGSLQYESARMVLPDNSASIPGYTRTDLAARYDTRMAAGLLTWRVGVDNLFDRRAWRESPYQFGHAYLFPQAARTWRVSVQADL